MNLPSHNQMVRNICRRWRLAVHQQFQDSNWPHKWVRGRDIPAIVPGFLWYENVNRQCKLWADAYGYSTHQVAGIIAVTSPVQGWEQQMRDVPKYLEDGTIGGGFLSNWVKASRIKLKRDFSVVKGPKVEAFFNCIMLADDVCIDRHAARVAALAYPSKRGLYNAAQWISPKELQAIKDAYIRAAEVINKDYPQGVATPAGTGAILARNIQAVTWVDWRREFSPRQKEAA